MRKNNRLAGVVVVVVGVVIGACLGEIELSSTSQEVIVADRNPVDVGTAMVGTSVTTSPSIVLSPVTEFEDDTVISISENCNDFSLSGTGSGARIYCDAGGGVTPTSAFGGATYGSGACIPNTYAFDATFTPTGPGLSSCAVTVTYRPTNAGSGSGSGSGSAMSYVLMLNGTGVSPTFGLDVSPDVIDFSDIPQGSTSSAAIVTIENQGSAGLSVVGTNSDPTNYSIESVAGSSFGSQSLAPGDRAQFAVSCTPQSQGPLPAMLTFDSNAGPRSVTLACNGTGPTDLAIFPAPVAFDPTLVGVAPLDVPVTITNNGAPTTLTVSLMTTSTDLAITGANPNGTSLGSGSSTTVTLHYAATIARAAGQIGTLVVGYGSGSDRNITVTAEALSGDIGTTPAIVEFGPVCVNATSTKDVMLYASAPGDVSVLSIAGAAAPFSVTPTEGRLTGNHSNSLSVTAQVTPTQPGELESSFSIITNLPTNPNRTVRMTATALPAGLSPTPDLVHFGPNKVGMTTSAKAVEVSNCGNTPINITGARIEGASAADFVIVAPENPAMALAQMGSVKFLVVMSPRVNGAKSAQLVVDYEGGSVTAALDGNGFGGEDTGSGERGTYYACSTGSGAGAAPIALALLLLRRRRRRA